MEQAPSLAVGPRLRGCGTCEAGLHAQAKVDMQEPLETDPLPHSRSPSVRLWCLWKGAPSSRDAQASKGRGPALTFGRLPTTVSRLPQT